MAQILKNLRAVLKERGLSGYLQRRADQHLSQYMSERDEVLARVTGFKGSNALLYVSEAQALIFTDTRYLGFTANQPFKLVIPPVYWEWYKDLQLGSAPIAFSHKNMSNSQVKRLTAANLNLVPGDSLLLQAFEQQPAPFTGTVSYFDDGTPTELKLQSVRQAMKAANLQRVVASDLSQIAHILNLRAIKSEYKFAPIFKAYLEIYASLAILYTDQKFSEEAREWLVKGGVEVKGYKLFWEGTPKQMATGLSGSASYALNTRYSGSTAFHFLDRMKQRKTKDQVEAIQKSCLKDGVALAEFFCELQGRLRRDQKISQLQAADIIDGQRGKQPGFVGLSFNTILGNGPNSAIIHHNASAQSIIDPSQLILLDSGGQYMDSVSGSGTTDITRTVQLGIGRQPTQKEKQAYTRVLIGNLDVEASRWLPQDKDVAKELDKKARAKLKEVEWDYGHGTGHGVGFLLNVHEGLVGISKLNQEPLEQGAVVSNEPGVYFPGEFGIRIQNMLAVKQTGDGLGFVNLSKFPYCLALIETSMLEQRHVKQINTYHAQLREQLTPLLSAEAREWLSANCGEVGA